MVIGASVPTTSAGAVHAVGTTTSSTARVLGLQHGHPSSVSVMVRAASAVAHRHGSVVSSRGTNAPNRALIVLVVRAARAFGLFALFGGFWAVFLVLVLLARRR